MFLNKNNHLQDLKRVRIPEGRDLENGLRLDRNEKVDCWPDNFMEAVLSNKPKCFLSTYPDMSTVYAKLSSHLGIKPEQILLSSGIDGVIKTLFEILTKPADIVGVLHPTYAMYDVYSQIFQTTILHIGYDQEFNIRMDMFEEFLKKQPVLFFIPNPNQPIESSLSLENLRYFAQRCNDVGCLLVIDEAYHYFGAESSLPLLKEFENVIIMRTFSKAFGVPSIRLGYMASTEENMEILSKTRFAHEANSLSAAIAEYLLDNFNIIEEYTQRISAARELVCLSLKNIGIKCHGKHGNYLLIDMETPKNCLDFVNYLKDRKIYVKGPWKEPWEQYITITLGPKECMAKFIDAIKEYKKNEGQK